MIVGQGRVAQAILISACIIDLVEGLLYIKKN
jgi:hypothetical protein